MFEEPVTTLQQAKEFFQSMGCSSFHMDREYPDRAREYRRLRISRRMEKEWTREQFDEYYRNIMANADPGSLWMWHSSMAQLLASLRSQQALQKMLEVTQFLRDKVPPADRVIVAETILGRTVRSARQGLIYMAYDWNDKAAAKAFAELALHFAEYDTWGNSGDERSQNAVRLCKEIQRELRTSK